jgi:hypothetical protein
MCKVMCSNHTEEEVTWEKEDQLNVDFPHRSGRKAGLQRALRPPPPVVHGVPVDRHPTVVHETMNSVYGIFQ